MPRTKSPELVAAAADPASRLVIMGFDDGRFCLMVHRESETLIHANLDGSLKLYPRVEDILAWVLRHTGRTEVMISTKNWRPPARRKRAIEGRVSIARPARTEIGPEP